MAIGTQAGVAAEVHRFMQGDRFAPRQGYGHQVVAAMGFHHAHPALAEWIDQAVGEGPVPRIHQSPGRGPWGAGWVDGQVVEATVAVVNQHQVASCHSKDASAVFVDAAPQVPVAWGELEGLEVGDAAGRWRWLHQQGGASLFVGPLLQPKQPAPFQ